MPRYAHDCPKCIFLGEDGLYDLYYCDREPTIVCRYTSDPPDYGSGICFGLIEMDGAKTCYRTALKLALKTKYRERIIKWVEKYQYPERLERLKIILKDEDC
jgi:hypothetical protein